MTINYGARRGNRTLTPLLERDFESRASTSSAIRAGLRLHSCFLQEPFVQPSLGDQEDDHRDKAESPPLEIPSELGEILPECSMGSEHEDGGDE